MENQILDQNYRTNSNPISNISPESLNFLMQIAKWAKYLSLLGFIVIGLLIIIGLFASSTFTKFMPAWSTGTLPSFTFAIIYSTIAIIYFFPVYYLFKFSNKLLKAFTNTKDLAVVFSNIQSHYKFLGVFATVFLGFYAIIGLLSIIGFTFA
jgi:hypothetical protein